MIPISQYCCGWKSSRGESILGRQSLTSTHFSRTISSIKAIDTNITAAQDRSNRNRVSGCSRYIVSRAEFRYHIVTGCSSFGGPQQAHSLQKFSFGNRFDSIMAMLCEKWER